MTISAVIPVQSAADRSHPPPPTQAQPTPSIPPSVPSTTVPTTSGTAPAPDAGTLALQLIQQMMESKNRREEELRRIEEIRREEKEARRIEKEKQRLEEMKRQEELRKLEEKAEERDRLRREELRMEQEARLTLETNLNKSMVQTSQVFTGPVPPPQSVLPSRPGEGTS